MTSQPARSVPPSIYLYSSLLWQSLPSGLPPRQCIFLVRNLCLADLPDPRRGIGRGGGAERKKTQRKYQHQEERQWRALQENTVSCSTTDDFNQEHSLVCGDDLCVCGHLASWLPAWLTQTPVRSRPEQHYCSSGSVDAPRRCRQLAKYQSVGEILVPGWEL